ncbi:hypothetical protein Y032_0047g1478 [Ancylostoma ceylanicum]|uniref:Uncharacterized protein n=1 Tax=Ancylostoma ceylanicum TaxID=53326 RepID=A0A016UB87_9BILA|nr:hypothetical protein Y032_0047g1478 [Ancylostoma ceylanicum]
MGSSHLPSHLLSARLRSMSTADDRSHKGPQFDAVDVPLFAEAVQSSPADSIMIVRAMHTPAANEEEAPRVSRPVC